MAFIGGPRTVMLRKALPLTSGLLAVLGDWISLAPSLGPALSSALGAPCPHLCPATYPQPCWGSLVHLHLPAHCWSPRHQTLLAPSSALLAVIYSKEQTRALCTLLRQETETHSVHASAGF